MWLKNYEQFKAAVKKGRAPLDVEVENSLYKRATGYMVEETVTETWKDRSGEEKTHTKKIKRHIPADPTAIIFWLKNRKPEQWRDKRTVIDEAATDDPLINLLKRLDNETGTEEPESESVES